MIKTIKIKKTKNLSELIAYIIERGIKDSGFVSNYKNIVNVDYSGQITTVGKFYNDTFTVEVEEEITQATKFVWLVEANDLRIWNQKNASISDVIDERTTEIRALIDGKLELIWEAR